MKVFKLTNSDGFIRYIIADSAESLPRIKEVREYYPDLAAVSIEQLQDDHPISIDHEDEQGMLSIVHTAREWCMLYPKLYFLSVDIDEVSSS